MQQLLYLHVYSLYAEIKALEEQETGSTSYNPETEKDPHSNRHL